MKIKLLLFFVFAAALNIFAQSPNTVLKRAEKVLGGAKKLRAAGAQRQTGTIIRIKDGARGSFAEQTAQPNLFNQNYDLNGFEVETGYNGKSAWQRDSREGLQTLTGRQSVELQAESDFKNSLWLDYKKDKAKIAAGGIADVNGKTANVVVYTTAKGVSIKLYFDRLTAMPIRREFPADGDVKIYDYDDYRAVNGLLLPFAVTLKAGGETYQIKLDDIKTGVPVVKSEFDFPAISGEPLPDIPGLLRELQANEDRIENILDTYSYTQKSVSRELDKSGVLRETGSEITQLSFYKGYRISRLIEKNGKPLSEKEQKNEDEEVQKRVAEIEKKIASDESKAASQAANGAPDERGKRVSIAEVLRASKLINPRRERFRGRDVVVFDFEPNPDFDYKNAKSILKFFGKTAGVIWIDVADKQVVRIEAVLADSFKVGGGVVAKLRKGASFMLEQQRVGDEIWLPSLTDINLSVRVFLVKGIDVNQLITSYDYRKFKTEVKADVNEK